MGEMHHRRALPRAGQFAWLPLILAALLAVPGCATTIPETDTSSPRVELLLSGAGIGSQRMSNPPRELWRSEGGTQYLDLLPDTGYRFTLTVSDDGGVARATLVVPAQMTVTSVSPDGVRTDSGALSHRLTLPGSRDDPRTALVISGRFRTPDLDESEVLSIAFDVESTDFGGRAGTSPNQTFMSVEAAVGAN